MNLGPENEEQEFKKSLAQLDKGLKSLSAMLNRNGHGDVYYGVGDNGEVIGLNIPKDATMDIRSKINDKIEPLPYTEINHLQTPCGKDYIKVHATGSNIPYSFDGRYYLRNVSADEKAPNWILRKMLTSSDADIMKQKTSPVQNLTFKALIAILSSCNIHTDNSEELLSNYGLFNEENKYNLNAYLLADNNNISIKIVSFAGNDKTTMSKRTEHGSKCILQSINEVMSYFESINETAVNLDGKQRKEQRLFDLSSFREAWINACLHNDWAGGFAPSIYIFEDRIEIESYGGLPFSLSKESFFKGKSVPVNKSLLTIMLAAKYAEQSGHGVPTIVKTYGKAAFNFDDGMLTVTIPFSFTPSFIQTMKTIFDHTNILSNNQKNVYYALKNNKNITLQKVADTTGLTLSGVKKIVGTLEKRNLVSHKGSRKSGYWETY